MAIRSAANKQLVGAVGAQREQSYAAAAVMVSRVREPRRVAAIEGDVRFVRSLTMRPRLNERSAPILQFGFKRHKTLERGERDVGSAVSPARFTDDIAVFGQFAERAIDAAPR
jgi:hypothetical protein